MTRAAAGGFTLIEMMIAIAIFALLVMAALPEFRTWVQNTQIRTAAEGMVNGLQLARTEAVRRNSNVQFEVSGASGWNVRVVSSGEIVQSRPSGEGSANAVLAISPAGATKTTFNGLGRQATNADGTAVITEIKVDVPTTVIAASATRELCIMVTSGGAVRLCDPQVAAGDTRACLPAVPAGCL